jgi:hypothetical protein
MDQERAPINQEAALLPHLIAVPGFEHAVIGQRDLEDLQGGQQTCHICHGDFQLNDLVTRAACAFGHIYHYICLMTLLTRGTVD